MSMEEIIDRIKEVHNCKDCKFYDIDYEWDNETWDEVEIEKCQKSHELPLKDDFDCPDFEKYNPKPYVEKFTECDKCEYLEQCKSEGNVLNNTCVADNFAHYVYGLGAYCRKGSKGET